MFADDLTTREAYMYGEQPCLEREVRRVVIDLWTSLRLVARHASASYTTLEDLQGATDWDMQVIANIGNAGQVVIYCLVGRTI